MITEIRKSRLRRLWNQRLNITQCARKCKMDTKTASRILKGEDLPRDKGPRSYRTHPDRLAPFWPEIEAMLQQDSALKAYILFEEMRTRHPETFSATWKRTLERRVRDWKLDHPVEQEVTFDQEHLAGDVLAIDFTSMNDLKITIAGERFDHLVFHGVLTFSNWEYAEVCLSESFEAIARGIQNTFHAMGGFPFEETSPAYGSSFGGQHRRTSGQRELGSLGVSQRADDPRMPITQPESNPATLKSIGIGAEQDLGSNRLDPIAENRPSKDGTASYGRVLEATEQRSDLWSSGYGKSQQLS